MATGAVNAGSRGAQVNWRATLRRAARRHPDKPALVEGERRLSFAELDAQVNRFAHHLLGRGLVKGERVATLDLGPRPAGTLTFAWDGKNSSGAVQPDGVYSFEAAATQNGRKVELERLGFGRVQSVTLGAQDLQLNTYGLGSLGMSRVAQIL